MIFIFPKCCYCRKRVFRYFWTRETKEGEWQYVDSLDIPIEEVKAGKAIVYDCIMVAHKSCARTRTHTAASEKT